MQKHDQSANASPPIAMSSYNDKIIFSPSVASLRIYKSGRDQPVNALMNSKTEYEHTAGEAQITVTHQVIDKGADFVVGNGTQWVQNTEVYKGKLIVYSTGNFIFDQIDHDGRLVLNLAVNISVPVTPNVKSGCNPE